MFRTALVLTALAALVPLSALAQLQVYEFDGTTDTQLSPLTSIGPVAPGGAIQARFHIRNMGTGPVSLDSLTLWGAAFSFISLPSLPYIIAPYTGSDSQVEFDINFSPEITGTFGAFLSVNSMSYALQGISALTATVTVSGSETPLVAGAVVDFGTVAVGSSQTQKFVLSNPGSTILTVGTIAVTGSGFSGPIGLNLPIQLSAGQSASFQVIFLPQTATAYQGVLSVDGRTFALLGNGSSAPAELQLFEFNGTADTPVANHALVNVGTAAPGDTVTTRFHVRNNGQAPVVLQQPAFSGAGFTMRTAQPFPYTLAPYAGPSSEAEIDVEFSPTAAGQFTATLAISDLSIQLQGTAAVSALVGVANGSTSLTAGASVDFGSVNVGATKTLTLILSNSSNAGITVSNVSVSGTCFSLVRGLVLPMQINPAQKISFQIAFAPQAGVPYQGTLSVDGRAFTLTGEGMALPLPDTSIVLDGPDASDQTNNISIALSSASSGTGNGTLQMSFRPAAGIPAGAMDPAISFLAGPGSEETVTINPGSTAALIDNQSQMEFQTGTTAGTITFTLTIENGAPQQTTLTIPPAVVAFDQVTAVRLPGEIDVAVQGFDNTYTASQMAFTFLDLNGNALPGGAINVDASSEFQPYFSTTQYGGMFQLLLKFPVSGNTAEIGSVSVGITNSVGTTTTTQPTAITY